MQSRLPGSRGSFLQAVMAAAGAGLSGTTTAIAASPKTGGQARPTQIVHNSWPQVEAYLKESDGIAELIAADGALARRHQILTSIAGVGTLTANQLVATMPELGNLDNKQVASLAGLGV